MLFEFGGLFRKFWRVALILGTFVIGANTMFVAPVSAATGINQQLNFQGRLLNGQGAIVPDGYYNVEFKIYQDGAGTAAGNPGGTLKWTEDWLNSGGTPVRVLNGYMSVQLGSINPFGNSIDWNQDTIWLSINIGNTSNCTIATNFTADCGGDGEMLPMKRMSAVPYALNAARLGGLTAAGFIQNTTTVQAATNMAIDGTARADTSILTPLIDTNTAVALNIGTTNATSINLNQNVTVAAGKSLTLAGGNTASRPASPTEGMVYYDTTTKQLLVYSNGKWQADRSTSTKIVAASTASQAIKDSADYVATGTSDQDIINTALTAAAGGKVYLSEGTFTTDNAISIPNNTTLAGAGRGSLIKFADIHGLTRNMITNTDTSTGQGITVRDLQLDGNYTGVNTTGTMYGMYFSGAGGASGSAARQGPTIINNWVNNFLTTGIYLSGSPNGVISGNNVQGTNGNGIYLSSSNRTSITGNVSQGNSGSGIVLGGTVSNTVSGNTFAVNGTAGVYLNGGSNNNTVSGNSFYNNGGNTANNAIYMPGSANADANTITGNSINDTSGTTTNYAINITDNTSDKNYLADNNFTSTAGTATINDAGTGTVYSNQARAENGTKLTTRTANDTEAFAVQNAAGSNIFAVDTTNNQVVIGNPSTVGKINLSDGSSNTLTLSVAALAGDYTLSIPTITANDTVCLQTLANCGSGVSGVTTVGALDGGTANANGATISGTIIYLQSASASFAGLVSTGSQTFAGAKTFNSNITLAAGQSIYLTGAGTASRPSLSSEGTLYYDTTTHQLLTSVYNSATSSYQWKASGQNAVLVAAANSSDADKAAADFVTDGSADQTEINYALTAADPAGSGRKTGKVYLFAGTYTINGTISVPNNTTLAGAGAGTVITIPNSVNATLTAITNATTGGNGTGVVIQDLKLDGNKANQTAGNYGMYGITFNGMGSSTLQGGKISNVWVNNWYGNGAFLWTYSGIYIASGQRNTISNVDVQGNSNNGLTITGTYNTVTGSDFTGNNYGIHLVANNNTISGNSASANTAIGIYLETASQNTITGNVATGNTNQNIYLLTSSSNTISGNQALGSSASDGIGLASTSTYNIISSNIIQSNSSGGVLLASSSSNNTVTSNKIHNNGGNNNKGIYFSSASNNTITNNTITDTANSASNNPINIDASSSNTYLSNNSFSSTATGGTIADAGTGTVYVNQPKAEGGGQITNRVANDAAAFTFQKADGTNVLTVDTSNSKILIAGALDTTTATTLSIGTSTATAISIGKAGVTTTIAGDTGVTLNATTGTTMVCRNTSGLLSTCDATYLTPTGTNFIQNQNASQQTGNFRISGTGQADTSILTPLVDTATAVALNIGTTNATSITLGKSAITTTLSSSTVNVGTSGSPTTILGATQTTNNTDGNSMTIAGSTGLGSGNGGTVTLQGGNAGASGTLGGNLTLAGGTGSTSNGVVILATSAFQTATADTGCFPGGSESTSTTNCTIAQSSINNNASVIIGFTNDGQTAFMPDPSIVTAGRVVYVTASGATKDFTLSVNGGGQGNLIAMRKNTTATMIWNGADWTAAGASSSTTLQAAYDNTLQSAGGAELVVSKTSATNGFTIRDSSVNPVNGALLTVQSSSAANLLSVNSNVTEYTTNSGAENYSGTTTTFPASTWVALTGATVSRNITTTDIATGQGSAQVATTTSAGSGVKNVLTTSLTAGQHYNVSFSAKLSSGTFTDLGVYYSIDGSTDSVTCATNQAVKTSVWTKVNCAFTAPSSGITSSNSINIRQVGSGTSRTFFVDNISVTIAADYNYATDGDVDDAGNFSTNWSYTTGTGTGSTTRNTSDGFNASSSAGVTITAGAANAGIKNKLAINPLASTLYRVSAYTKLSSGTFTDLKIRYSPDGGTNFVDCVDYNTQTVTTSAWTQVTCYINTSTTAVSNPYVYFVETASAARTYYVDAFSMTLASNSTPNVQIGSGSNGGPTTLFTLDKGASAPIAANNDALLGSMYYDTTLGKLQCYEADGWGACGSSPDNIITISPEYTNAVLHGTGIGTMTSDVCSDFLDINDATHGSSVCGTNETYNFYKWTSPQATSQTYSIYVTYQLPTTFKSFNSGQTSLMGRTDSSNSTVNYQVYRNSSSGLTQCGSTVSVSTGSQTSWQTGLATGAADPSTCSFGPADSIVFKINMSANSNANAYVGNLNFSFSNK